MASAHPHGESTVYSMLDADAQHAADDVAHHFEDATQQREAAELGMWLFLVTEVMFFAALFLGYAIFRHRFPEVFAHASHHMNIWIGTVNTCVLLASSLTMALAVHAAAHSDRRKAMFLLAATIVLGATFLVVKGFEYHEKYAENHLPVRGFDFHYADDPRDQQAGYVFFSLYFLMTGVHAFHMVIGIAVLLVLLVGVQRGRFLGSRATAVHCTGLYWHFVDIVWVFLFPMLYLVGTR